MFTTLFPRPRGGTYVHARERSTKMIQKLYKNYGRNQTICLECCRDAKNAETLLQDTRLYGVKKDEDIREHGR